HTRSKRDWSSDVCSSDLDHLIRLVESTCLEQLAQQICTRCEYKHWEHSLTRSLPCPPPAVQRFTDTAGEHQCGRAVMVCPDGSRSEEHTSELQSRFDLVC